MSIMIDMEMPENCYVCPLMMWCDPCEGYSNHCVFGWEMDCGYIMYKSYRSKEVIADHSNGTYTSRHKDCPLKGIIRCGKCRHYQGNHDVQGCAPCDFWGIGAVMWDDYCSRGEVEG